MKRLMSSTWLGILLMVYVILFTVGSTAYVIHAEDNATEARCRDRLQAEWLVAISDTFDTPPAPNPERAKAVANLRHASERLRRADSICS